MKSAEKNFLFIHIPKTGGNAVQKVLMPYCDDQIYRKGYQDGKLNDFEIKNELGICRKHEWIGAYINNSHLIKGGFDEYFKFTVVRNPWERMVSWYCWRHPSLSQHLDLDHFRTHCLNLSHPSMLEYISYDQNIRVDHIIRYENLESEFRQTCAQLNIPFNGWEHTNASKHPHYSQFYTPADRDFVEEKYKNDIDEFGYKFEKK
jgi:hypothetical protein